MAGYVNTLEKAGRYYGEGQTLDVSTEDTGRTVCDIRIGFAFLWNPDAQKLADAEDADTLGAFEPEEAEADFRLYLTIFAKDKFGQQTKQLILNQSAIKQLADAFEWRDADVDSLPGFAGTPIQCDVKAEEYKGETKYRPNWIYHADANPSGRVHRATAAEKTGFKNAFAQDIKALLSESAPAMSLPTPSAATPTAAPKTAKTPAAPKTAAAPAKAATPPLASRVAALQEKVQAGAADLAVAIEAAGNAAWELACVNQGAVPDETLSAMWEIEQKRLNPRNVQQWENLGNVIVEQLGLLNNPKPKPTATKARPGAPVVTLPPATEGESEPGGTAEDIPSEGFN